jgi:hypothetical protein
MSKKSARIFVGAVLAGLAGSAHAAVVGTSLSVNFVGGSNSFPGQSLLSTDVAGVVPSANWNNLTGASGSQANLNADINGVAVNSGASVTWASSGTWSTDDEGNTSQFVNGADEKLMSGYIDVFENAPATISFSGLPNGLADVIVYSLTAVDGRDSGNISINGVNKKSTSIISTVFVPGGGPGGDDNVGGVPGNYNLFPNVLVTDGTINISMNGQTFRTAINGIQIVAVPEPTAIGFIGLAGAALLGRRRK